RPVAGTAVSRARFAYQLVGLSGCAPPLAVGVGRESRLVRVRSVGPVRNRENRNGGETGTAPKRDRLRPGRNPLGRLAPGQRLAVARRARSRARHRDLLWELGGARHPPSAASPHRRAHALPPCRTPEAGVLLLP